MHTSFNLRFATLATLVLASLGGSTSAIAAPLFGQQEVDQNKFAVIASPYGGTAHQLLIVKQISNVRPCWSESNSGSGLTTINPLLAEFDFTDICGRSTDSNGYSVRVGGEDLNWRYSLQALKEGNDILLVARPNIDRTAPRLVVGRTRGYSAGFAKFYLEPGWRLTERSYEGTSLGHVYLTNDQTLASLNAMAIAARPVTPAPIVSRPTPPVATVTPPVYTSPVVTPVQPTSKPVQNRRPSLWERVFGQSRRTVAPSQSSSYVPRVQETSTVTGNRSPVVPAGDFVVPTIQLTQP